MMMLQAQYHIINYLPSSRRPFIFLLRQCHKDIKLLIRRGYDKGYFWSRTYTVWPKIDWSLSHRYESESAGFEVISLQKQDCLLVFDYNWELERFLQSLAGGIWIKIHLNPKINWVHFVELFFIFSGHNGFWHKTSIFRLGIEWNDWSLCAH